VAGGEGAGGCRRGDAGSLAGALPSHNLGRVRSLTIERKAVELLSILPADVAPAAEVAARDAGISKASFMCLRRAMDRAACAQSVLETVRADSEGAADELEAMREAVELLARGWPDEHSGRGSGVDGGIFVRHSPTPRSGCRNRLDFDYLVPAR
jgi:hypothetical protein